MIDPRMIRPEAVAPTTDIVTPTPQYYGQGQVVGGQIQLGDVYGKLPSQSQEEYMYGNLANIANAAMGLAQVPGQLEQAQRRRDQRHDQDALNMYQIELNNIEQSSLNGDSFYKYGNTEYSISNPEDKSKLELHLQEKMLGGLITSSGKAEASRLRTSSLSQRNRSIDGRIQELLVEYKNEFNKFKSENILLNPVAFDEAYRSNPVLNELREQIQSYRDTDSTVFESAIAQMNEEGLALSRDASIYLVEESTREITESYSVLANTLPNFLDALQNPSLPPATEFMGWVGEVDNPEDLFGLVGITPEAEAVPGMLLDTVGTTPTTGNIRELMRVILDHQLQKVEILSPEQRDTLVRGIVDSSKDKIAKAVSDHYARQTQKNLTAAQMARMESHRNTVREAGNDNYTVNSGAYTSMPREDFKGLIGNDLENNNVGNDPKKFVTFAARSYWLDNFGMPGGPVSAGTVRNAAFVLEIREDDLFKLGFYRKDEDGKVYLTDKGIEYQQDKTRELINELVKTNGYKDLVRTAVGNIRANNSVQGAPTLEAASIAINNQVVGLVRKYFPLGQSITDDDILKTFGLVTDPEQEPSQALLSVMGSGYSREIKAEVRAVLDAWEKSTETTSVSSTGSTANSWITTQNPQNNPKLRAEALDYLERVLSNPDEIGEEWARLIRVGKHNPASLARLHHSSMDLNRRTYTGNISLRNLTTFGLIDPSTTVSTEDLANFDVNKELGNDPRNLLIDSKYFDRSTFKFTQKGAVAWAAYTNQLLHGPLTDKNSRNVIKDFIENVSALEENASSEEGGIYLMALASFIKTSQQASIGGIGERHSQRDLTSIKEVRLPDGSIVPLSYNPTIDPPRDWNSIYMSVDEKSFTLAAKMAFRISQRIASVPDKDTSPEKVRELIQLKAQEFAGLISASRIDRSDHRRTTSSMLASGLGDSERKSFTTNTFPDTPVRYIRQIKDFVSNEEQDTLTMWGLLAGIPNFRRNNDNQVRVTSENVDRVASQFTRGAINLLQRMNSNLYLPAPEVLVDGWNRDSTNSSDLVREGARIRLWSADPKETTVLSLLEYSEETGTLAGIHEIPELRTVLGEWMAALSTSSPGNPDNFEQLVGMSIYLDDQNYMPKSLDDNIFENVVDFNDTAMLTVPDPMPGNNIITIRNYSGTAQANDQSTIVLPDEYSPEQFRTTGIPITDSDGHPLFANYNHEITSMYLESTPKSSTDSEAYSRARLDLAIKNIPGLEKAWPKLSEERRTLITRLSNHEDVTLISFMRGAAWLASRENADVSNVEDFPAFTFNVGGLENKEFRRRVNQGGWLLTENRSSSHLYELNDDGYYVITNNTTGASVVLDPNVQRHINTGKVLDSIAGPPPIHLRNNRNYFDEQGEFSLVRAIQNQKNVEAQRQREQQQGGTENNPLSPILQEIIKELQVDLPNTSNADSGFWDGEKTISSNTSASGSSLGLGGIASALSQAAIAAPPQEDVARLLIEQEGFISTPRKATKTETHLTVGHGHKLDGSKRSREAFKKSFPDKNYDEFKNGKGSLTKEEAFRLFQQDIPYYINRAKDFTNYQYTLNKKTGQRPKGKKLGGLTFDDHSDELQKQIISATYRGSWGQSPKARRLLSEGKYEEAADEFLNNNEYKNAVKLNRRGIRARMEAVAKAIREEAKRNKT